jgi:hypothetical protein
MSNNMKNIYGGLNPIFESMSNSLKEDKGSSKASVKGMDVVSAVSTALNTVFSILMNSKNESAKTPRGFEEIKNKILGTNNFGSFRQYLVSLVQSFGALDNAQRDAYEKNVKFIVDLLSGDTEATLSDTKIYDSLRKDIISKLLINFSNDLKERETQLRKTNPKLFGEVVKQGLVVKENADLDEKKKSGEETDVEDAEFRGAAFNKSKESLDAASAFVGMIDRDKYVPVLKDNEDVKRYKEIAEGLYKKAQDMQMIDRKGVLGGKIVTASGEYKAKEYKRAQDDLLNEIIRQKKEYSRIKDGILKNNNVTPAPPVTPVCPPGKRYDEGKGICVDIVAATGDKKPKPKPVPVPTTECTFPVQLGKRCKDVGTIQAKLMEILPSVAEYLPKYGGVDNKYGSATAKAVNIVWSYVSKNTLKIDGELTKDMYDTILALTAEDVDKVCYKPTTVGSTGAKESLSWEMSIEDKIEEREEIKGSPILSFEDFYSVIEESYKFSKLDEQEGLGIFSNLKSLVAPGAAATGATGPIGSTVTNKKLIDCCVKDSILGNTLVDCIGASGASGASGETGGDIEWKGLKPIQDGSYTVFYDESWSDWWGDLATGAVITGIIIGAVIVTGGTLAVVLPAAALPGAATFAGGAALVTGAIGGTVGITTGIIGGAAVAKWAGNDRKPVSILVYNGYLEPVAVKGMARGLYNSMGGTISSQDMLAIYSTLILCRGTFTDDGDGKAISVWEKIKKEYSSFDGDNLVGDINAITTSQGVAGFFKDLGTDMDDLPSFPPNFKTKDPNRDGGSVTFEGAKDACVDAVQKLDKNSTKLRENLTHITEKDLELLSDSMGDITEQVEAKMSGEGSEEE